MSSDNDKQRHPDQPSPDNELGSVDDERSLAQRRAVLRRLSRDVDNNAELPPSNAVSPQRPSVWSLSLSASVGAQRRVRIVSAVSGALLVAVVVAALALHATVGLPLPGSSSTPLLPGQINRVYLDVDVPWATVTLDGRTITPPIIGKQAPLTLAPGTHAIRWTADPFDPQSCVLSIPASRNDTCQLSTAQVVTLPHQPTAQLVYLGESLATLSTPQQAALNQAIQAAMAGYTTVAQTGESYSKPWDVASQSVHVTLGETLNANASGFNAGDCFYPLSPDDHSCLVDGRNCVQICTLPWLSREQLPSPDPHAWYAFALAVLTWNVNTLDGRTLSSDQFVDPPTPNQPPGAGDPVLLQMRWTGTRWSAQQVAGAALPPQLVVSDGAAIPDDPACVDAYDLLAGIMNPTLPDAHPQAYSQVRFISGPNPAMGCLAEATVGTPGKPPAKGAPVARYLDRFGMVYALNSVDAPDLMPPGLTNQPTALQQQVAQSLSAYPGQLYVLPAGVGAGQ